MESFLIFDPGMVILKPPASDAERSGKLVAKPGDPEIKLSHVIPITKDGTVRLTVYRILGDGSAATTNGFTEELDPKKASNAAAAGNLVIRLGTPW